MTLKNNDLVEKASNLFKQEKYRLTMHAEHEREQDSLSLKEVEECFFNDTIELIEDYPEDPRGHSFLLLGFTQEGEPVHFVCGIHEEELVMITLYRPDEEKWKNWRERVK